MKTLTVPTDFSDCTTSDISHYFEGTVGVWNMTPTKRRVFLFGNVDQDEHGRAVISGQYLTRQKEWRYKQIPLIGWNTTIKPILSKIISFNHDGVAGFLAPNRTKELKKGLKWNYTGIKWWHGLDSFSPSAQSITYEAFKDLYVDPSKIYHPSLQEIVENGIGPRQSVITHNGFVIDNMGGFWYRKNRIGVYGTSDRVVTLTKNLYSTFAPYLAKFEGLKGRIA